MSYEEIRIPEELDRAVQRAVGITPAGRTSLLAWESKSNAGHFLKFLRTLVGIRAAFAKIRIGSVWAGQSLRCPFGQIRREPDGRNQVRSKMSTTFPEEAAEYRATRGGLSELPCGAPGPTNESGAISLTAPYPAQ